LTVTVNGIRQALEAYITTRATLKTARALLADRLVRAQNSINDSNRAYQQSQSQAEAREINGTTTAPAAGTPAVADPAEANGLRNTTIAQIQSQIDIFNRNFDAVPQTPESFDAYVAQYNNLAGIVNAISGGNHGRHPVRLDPQAPGANPNGAVLMSYLIGQYRTTAPQSGDTVTDPSGTTNQSATLLENLSDRKASLSLTVPGYYRYYSASHPTPEMQGYEDISPPTETQNRGTTTTTGSNTTSAGADPSGLTPIVRRPGARGTAGGYLTGARVDEAQRTTAITPLQAARYIAQAWRRVIRSPPLNRSILEILVAQWSHETGSGRSMMNNNFGGLKYGGAGRAAVYNLTHETLADGRRVELRGAAFQAYATPEIGAAHFVTFLTSRNWVSAIQQYIATGDPVAYARGLSNTPNGSYFGGQSPEVYGNDLGGRVRGIRGSGILNQIPNLPPDPGPQQTENQTNVPDSPIATYSVRPITDGQGLPPERLGHYVELVPNITPTKGLRIRLPAQDGTFVVPTNVIYSMSFEARKRRVYTNTTVPRNNPNSPARVSQFIESCFTPDGPIVTRLTELFKTQVGTPALSQGRGSDQVRELIELAVAGIDGLKTAGNTLIQNTLNIPANGTPGGYNPSGQFEVNLPRYNAETVLRAKAVGLIRDVTEANAVQLREAQRLIARLGPNDTLTTEIQDLLQPWEQCLQSLYRGNPLPDSVPFRTRNSVEFTERESTDFSPVFPVSDALGYEHYGSFQYGRGLSIEPGGNYERLMSTDPLQYLNDSQRERLLRELRSREANRESRVRALFDEFARDPRFSSSPGAQAALSYLEPDQRNGDQTTMIVNGMANYVMSDRDAVMKMPINNVAYQLADLRPMGQQDTCECRGAEADLLLAAYMAGTESYALITSDDEASVWVSSQMEQAAGAWSESQSRMRGMAAEQGRRSILDTVEGWEGAIDNFRTTNERNLEGARTIIGRADDIGNQTKRLFTTPLVPNRGQ
jgi:hypothetical protein